MNIEPIKLMIDAGLNVIPAYDTKAPYSIKVSKEKQLAYKIDKDISWKIFQYEKLSDLSVFEKHNNKGIVCGAVSGGLECIDIDSKYDLTGTMYNRFVELIPPELFSKLFIETSVNGGYHVLYLSEILEGNKKLAQREANPEEKAKGERRKVLFETRGEGGFVVTYPTKGYDIVQGDICNLPHLTLDERDSLMSAAVSFNEIREAEKQPVQNTTPVMNIISSEFKVSTFEDYNNKNSCLDLLLNSGWKEHTSKGDRILLTRPGKDKGVSGDFSRSRNLFYCFTSSTEFDSEKAYNPVQVYAFLHHNGDYSATSKELYSIGYGSRFIPKNERKKPEDILIENEHITDDFQFPLHIMPKSIQNLINSLYESYNYPIDYSMAGLMAAVSTLAGNSIRMKVKNGWETPAIFWLSVVGAPGTIKSHPIRFMTAPLKAIDRNTKKSYDVDLAAFNINEELEKGQKDRSMVRPSYYQYLVNDATIESIFRIHATNENGICYYKDELIGWFNSMGQYKAGGKGSDQEFWLESFNNSSYIVNRVNADVISLDNININLIGTIQPDVLSKISRGNGLAHRFLFTKTHDFIPYMTLGDVPEKMVLDYENGINALNLYVKKLAGNPEIITADDDDLRVFLEINKYLVDKQRHDSTNTNMKSYYEKLKTYTPRFALLMDIIWRTFGDNETMPMWEYEMAFELVKYFEQTAINIFAEVDKKEELSSVLSNMKGKTKTEQIKELLKKGIKQTDIAKQLNASKSLVSRINKTI